MTTVQTSTSQSKDEAEAGKRFNPFRLTFARTRRGLKKTDLAKATGLSTKSITNYELGDSSPAEEHLDTIASFLRFPRAFFFEEGAVDEIHEGAVSFRAMTKMGLALRNSALGAGAIALMVDRWIQDRFVLPACELSDLGRDMSPETAAQALRQQWGLGEQPIKNMVHLLEAKGVRVYSLAIDAKEVDAFSTWSNGRPFVFLNTQKSSEHSRFDAAHELGHLVLHKHGSPSGQEAEKEANAFASAFLMPARSLLALQWKFPTLDGLVRAKRHWGVSVAALNYRLHTLELTTDWIYRNLCIQLSQAGYRTNEPKSIPRETSQILEKVFASLREEGIGKADIAADLQVLPQELDELTYGLLRLGAVPERGKARPRVGSNGTPRPKLSVVK